MTTPTALRAAIPRRRDGVEHDGVGRVLSGVEDGKRVGADGRDRSMEEDEEGEGGADMSRLARGTLRDNNGSLVDAVMAVVR